MDKIREFQHDGRTIILVSHSTAQVMEVCDEGVVLHDGAIAFVGSAADATKVHRDILEGRRRELVVHDEVPTAPVMTPTVTGITLRPGDTDDTVIAPGDELTIEVHVRLPEQVAAWNTSVSIDTPHGQQVFGTGSRRLDAPHGPHAAGEATAVYVLPRVALAGGSYFVNASVADAEGTTLDVLWQGATFSIPYAETQTGTVYSEAHVSEA